MRMYTSSRAKRKRFHGKRGFQMFFVDFRSPYWCTKVVHQHGDSTHSSTNRVWKGFCVIRDSAEMERVIREYRKNPAVICEFYIGCDAGFSLYVVCDP